MNKVAGYGFKVLDDTVVDSTLSPRTCHLEPVFAGGKN